MVATLIKRYTLVKDYEPTGKGLAVITDGISSWIIHELMYLTQQ